MLEASPDEIYDIELEHSLLEANGKLAVENRALLDQHGITAIDFMGAIGSGKTTLITKLVEKLRDRIGVAVFNGDATTSNDADGISAQNVPVVQIATEGPWMVRKHPHMFLGAQVVIINKIDLAEAMEVSVEQLIEDVRTLKPDIKVIPTSCKRGIGLDEVVETLLAV